MRPRRSKPPSRAQRRSFRRQVIVLADTTAGQGCMAHLSARERLRTIERESNFFGTVLSGRLGAEASIVHGGRTIHLWDSVFRDGSGKSRPSSDAR